MIGDSNMENLMDKLARLDVSEEATQLDNLKQQTAELTAARERGHKRTLEIAKEVEALKAGRGDGESAAEALLAGDNVALAAPQQQALEEERVSIKAGMGTLAEREREISHRRAGIIDIVESKSAAAFEDQVADLERRAKTLAGELATVAGHRDVAAELIFHSPIRIENADQHRLWRLVGERCQIRSDVLADLLQAMTGRTAFGEEQLAALEIARKLRCVSIVREYL